jgi:flagellar hook-basal body complex protein FliE
MTEAIPGMPAGFVPDVAAGGGGADNASAFGSALGEALSSASSALDRAQQAESAFASGRGGIQEMVVERAQADILLSLAATTASRTTQSLATILNMQV